MPSAQFKTKAQLFKNKLPPRRQRDISLISAASPKTGGAGRARRPAGQPAGRLNNWLNNWLNKGGARALKRDMLEVFWSNFFKEGPESEGGLKFIKKCPLFSSLSAGETRFLRKILHKRIYADGEIIFKPSSGIGMYIILKGQVNILHGSPDSQEDPSLVSSLKPGDFFGELALIQNQGYKSMFARSASDSQLLGFFQPDLQFLLENRPVMGVKILKPLCEILSRRLCKAEQKILQAGALSRTVK